jgi:hypothetical protein
MPTMPTVVPEENTDRQVVTYVHKSGSNLRIQLDALDDERDARGRLMKKGETLVAQFHNGIFTTNIADLQDKIEGSYAYRAAEIQRQDHMEKRALDSQLDSMMDLAKDNPELAGQLSEKLVQMQKVSSATDKAKRSGKGTGKVVVGNAPSKE